MRCGDGFGEVRSEHGRVSRSMGRLAESGYGNVPIGREGKALDKLLGATETLGWFEDTSSPYNRPICSTTCRSMRVKIVTSFLELQNHDWGL